MTLTGQQGGQGGVQLPWLCDETVGKAAFRCRYRGVLRRTADSSTAAVCTPTLGFCRIDLFQNPT